MSFDVDGLVMNFECHNVRYDSASTMTKRLAACMLASSRVERLAAALQDELTQGVPGVFVIVLPGGWTGSSGSTMTGWRRELAF